MIPRLIHQTWKDAQIPAVWLPLQRSFREQNPGWEYRLWSDVGLRELIRRRYGWFLPIYDGYQEPIMRVDAARYFLMHRYGGVYADLDFECLRPLDPLIAGNEVILGREPDEHLELPMPRERGLSRIVCNAFIASAPKHPFWDHVIRRLVGAHRERNPLDATGPFFLTRALARYAEPGRITVTPPELLYPVRESERDLLADPAARAPRLEHAFAVHHWSGSWWRAKVEERASVEGEPSLPVWLLDRGQRILAGALYPDQVVAPEPGEAPLVSCLMVTRGRAAAAERAIHCFVAQTYPNKELVIIDDDLDDTLASFVSSLGRPEIVHVRLPPRDRSIGERRALATEHARGAYLASWEDGELSHPQRLRHQLAALSAARADACALMRETLLWPARRRLASSAERIWESSLVCARDAAPRARVVADRRVALLDAPELRLHVLHGQDAAMAEEFEARWNDASERQEGVAYARALPALLATLPAWVARRVAEEVAQFPPPAEAPGPDDGPEEGDAGSRVAVENRGATTEPTVLILTPVKDAAGFLDRFLQNLYTIDYPRDKLSIAFLEGDSSDGTLELLSARLPDLERDFARASLFQRDYQLHLPGPRWDPAVQLLRRSILARSRNYLLSRALRDEAWVLWVDVDVTDYPATILRRLLATGEDIVVPHCVVEPGGRSFDLNTFKLGPEAATMDWSVHIRDGLLQPPPGQGRLYLEDLRDRQIVQVDGVGGCMLLVNADLHREGLIFPGHPYKLHIETEGLAMMAKDMGHACWALPNLEIVHPPPGSPLP